MSKRKELRAENSRRNSLDRVLVKKFTPVFDEGFNIPKLIFLEYLKEEDLEECQWFKSIFSRIAQTTAKWNQSYSDYRCYPVYMAVIGNVNTIQFISQLFVRFWKMFLNGLQNARLFVLSGKQKECAFFSCYNYY